MKSTTVTLVALIQIGALSACDILPRGAGLQSEVLAVARSENTENVPAEFAIEVVTRANLRTFLSWPRSGPSPLPWIDRVDQPNTRTIAAGDTLRVTIWSTEDNGLLLAAGQRFVTLPDLRVSSSGSVFLPYVGETRVSGMSPERAREVIEEQFINVTPSAQVQIEQVEGRAQSVSLIGGVAKPGPYTLPDNDYTLLDLISAGGGISTALNNPQVRLRRNERLYGISADDLLAQPSHNTTLAGGDLISIEEDDRTFLSLGAAGSEAVHKFPSDRLSALEALSIIGGVSDSRADPQGILILRRYLTSQVTADRSGPDHPRTIFTLDLTTADGLFSAAEFDIQPDDLVYVTESPVLAANTIFGLFGSIVGIGNQLTN